jgi:hypothetical protein
LGSEEDAINHIRVTQMEYHVTDSSSAVLAGRLWVWMARVIQYVATLLSDLDTAVLEDLKVDSAPLTSRLGER